MRKESIIIFGLTALISVGIVGAFSYFHYKSNQRQAPPATTNHQLPPVLTPNKQPYANTRQQTRKVSTSGRLKYPQKCTDADGSITFTDQPNCANAKPKHTLSIVDSVSAPPRQTKPQNRLALTANQHLVTSRSKPFLEPWLFPANFQLAWREKLRKGL